MSSRKHEASLAKRHFEVLGPSGKDPLKGSKWWVCDLKFLGNLSRMEEHFTKGVCAVEKSTKTLTAEEILRRKEGLRQARIDAGMPRDGANALLVVTSLVAAFTGGGLAKGAGDACGKAAGDACDEGVGGSGPGITVQLTSASTAPAARMRQMLLEETNSVVTKNEETSRRVDRWMTCTNQPFNMVENEFYLDMVNAIREAHPSWRPHSREAARNGRLNGQHQRAVEDVGRLAKEWARSCCMVQVDGWSDRRGRPHVNVMVSSPIGTVFWKSVCVAGKDKDASAYYKILTTAIEEIGPRSVVGVIMDNARICVKAGKLVEKKYLWIFWVGCTAHALDLALEDMDKRIPWFAETVKRGNVLGKFKKAAAKTRKRDDIIDDDGTKACSSSSNSSEEEDDEDHDPIDGKPRSAEEGTEHEEEEEEDEDEEEGEEEDKEEEKGGGEEEGEGEEEGVAEEEGETSTRGGAED
ncbi:hypothetical protein CBR_g54096 [Chara braunii]|uniref:DUF659 domain-containing protein n=1 Tax=Chara braunii TaxID=69332 RepID=A0A388MBP3_CHABU|nr:hypothetical protein CBR_g54096 [Chara braunii]|eukprot:GBG92001.1 hypothetical protein CBR_g54096 [Chara braunii]